MRGAHSDGMNVVLVVYLVLALMVVIALCRAAASGDGNHRPPRAL